MNRQKLTAGAAVLGLSLLPFAGGAIAAEPESAKQATPAATSVDNVVADWPEPSKNAAMMMVEKYGQPQGVTPTMLVWNDQAPWKEIIVSKEPVPHHFPIEHPDVLEQVIDYQVPPDKFDDLAAYDGSVIAERTRGTLSARCDKEPMNFLALNLAHDIVTGKKTVDEARQFYAQTAMAFMKGEKHPYTQKLQFDVPKKAGDPDKPAMKK